MKITNLPEDFGNNSGLTKDFIISDDTWDFCGWAVIDDMIGLGEDSKILQGAFDEDDKKVIPLIWAHNYNNPECVLGRAILVRKPGGIYCYGKFFENSETAKECWRAISNGKVRSLSIYAGNLKLDKNKNVIKGTIFSVSLVYWEDQPEEYRDTIIEKWKETIS